ncbi:MAG: hypothetical protein ABI680_07690 [Chthoniobacteraceae bacterium]
MTDPSTKTTRDRRVLTRFGWFLAGAAINYVLISTPFEWLRANTDLPVLAIAACSLAVSTTVFFFWNYFVNFRTAARKREAFPRYLGAVVLMWALSTCTLTFLKHTDFSYALTVAGHALDLDIVATQFFLSGLKFFLYHKWVFPLGNDDPRGE